MGLLHSTGTINWATVYIRWSEKNKLEIHSLSQTPRCILVQREFSTSCLSNLHDILSFTLHYHHLPSSHAGFYFVKLVDCCHFLCWRLDRSSLLTRIQFGKVDKSTDHCRSNQQLHMYLHRTIGGVTFIQQMDLQ